MGFNLPHIIDNNYWHLHGSTSKAYCSPKKKLRLIRWIKEVEIPLNVPFQVMLFLRSPSCWCAFFHILKRNKCVDSYVWCYNKRNGGLKMRINVYLFGKQGRSIRTRMRSLQRAACVAWVTGIEFEPWYICCSGPMVFEVYFCPTIVFHELRTVVKSGKSR